MTSPAAVPPGRPGAVIILAPHRSFSSVFSTMLGQHPELCGLPETNLFVCESMLEWWSVFEKSREIGSHGLLRAVAHLRFGAQGQEEIDRARAWIRARLHLTTGGMFQELAALAAKPIAEKSPPTTYRIENMHRALRACPDARVIHLVRHPVGHGLSVVAALNDPDYADALPRFARRREPSGGQGTVPRVDLAREPEAFWLRHHDKIRQFLSSLPTEQWLRVRGEDVMDDPARELERIAAWLGLTVDAEAVRRMCHPEESPFARLGPAAAPLGNDPGFLRQPDLRPTVAPSESLAGGMPWADGRRFPDPVVTLARSFGYS
jgi:hypothetical protein